MSHRIIGSHFREEFTFHIWFYIDKKGVVLFIDSQEITFQHLWIQNLNV